MTTKKIALFALAVIWLTACQDPPIASFEASPETSAIGDTVYFRNTSQNAETFNWDFKDGQYSTEEHPTHIFAEPGNYEVELTAGNSRGEDKSALMIHILSPSSFCWSQLPNLPTPRHSHMAVVVDGSIYVGGGYNPGNGFEAYDISQNKWSSKAVLDYWGQYPAACVLDGKIYYMGGWYQNPAYDYLQVYDPVSNKWEMKAPMPRKRSGHIAFPAGGKICVIGGCSEWPIEKFYNEVDVYDPADDSWSTLGSPGGSGFTPRWSFGACMAGGRIYVIGGTDGLGYMPPGITIPALDIVEEYNPETNTWTKKASMPTPRMGLAAVTVGDKIYAIGGFGEWEPKEFTPVVEVYDPATDTWEAQGSMPRARGAIVAVEYEGIIYIPGGGGFEPRDEWDYFSSYDPACGSSSKK